MPLSMEELDEKICAAESAVGDTPHHDRKQADDLMALSWLLMKRHSISGSLVDLDKALDAVTRAIELTIQHDEILYNYLNILAHCLSIRFHRNRSLDDFNKAMDAMERAMVISPTRHLETPICFKTAGNLQSACLLVMKSSTHRKVILDAGLRLIQFIPPNHPALSRFLHRVAGYLCNGNNTASAGDLKKAIHIARKGVDLTSNDDPDLAIYLSQLGELLHLHHDNGHTGSDLSDLDEAISLQEKALAITPQIIPNQQHHWVALASMYRSRYQRTRLREDINKAIHAGTNAVEMTAPDHPKLADRGAFLGRCLRIRSDESGSIEDLNEAINSLTKTVGMTSQNHPIYLSLLNDLGAYLSARGEITASMDDLTRALATSAKVMEMVSANSSDPDDFARYLGLYLTNAGRYFRRTKCHETLENAISIADQTIDVVSPDRPGMAVFLNNFGALLGERSNIVPSIDDLTKAVDMHRRALAITPAPHPNRPSCLGTLASRLSQLYEAEGVMDHLDEAVEIVTEAKRITPAEHPQQAFHNGLLGHLLGQRFKETKSKDDEDRQLSAYLEGWHCLTASPRMRVGPGRAAAAIYAKRQDWKNASDILEQVVFLLQSSRSSSRQDMLRIVSEFDGVASDAAAAVINSRKNAVHALQVLELGRGIIAGLTMDIRTDVSLLRQAYPHLANEYISLRDELDSPALNPERVTAVDRISASESWSQRRHEIDQQFKNLIDRIRTQPGFDRFLLPPTKEELIDAAHPDPIVVINSSQYRCDAFLIEKTGVRIVELSHISQNDVFQKAANVSCHSDLGPLLEWLWHGVCRPCLDVLGLSQACPKPWPHVWWIPTGPFGKLPLHAAGRVQSSTETVIDRTMSSYASSVKALIHGRRKPILWPKDQSTVGSAILVGMQRTQGMGYLHFADDEIAMVKDWCQAIHLDAVTPHRVREDVLSNLRACKVFHFAGHARSDRAEPSQSCLFLEDWKTSPLTIEDLNNSHLEESSPFLAYLSACSTGSNNIGSLSDEGVHLIGAFHLSGFRHVIGTLWEVCDKSCIDVARVLYKTLRDEGMTDRAVSHGLHQALRLLRDRDAEDLKKRDVTLVDEGLERPQRFHWIPYIHYGA